MIWNIFMISILLCSCSARFYPSQQNGHEYQSSGTSNSRGTEILSTSTTKAHLITNPEHHEQICDDYGCYSPTTSGNQDHPAPSSTVTQFHPHFVAHQQFDNKHIVVNPQNPSNEHRLSTAMSTFSQIPEHPQKPQRREQTEYQPDRPTDDLINNSTWVHQGNNHNASTKYPSQSDSSIQPTFSGVSPDRKPDLEPQLKSLNNNSSCTRGRCTQHHQQNTNTRRRNSTRNTSRKQPPSTLPVSEFNPQFQARKQFTNRHIVINLPSPSSENRFSPGMSTTSTVPDHPRRPEPHHREQTQYQHQPSQANRNSGANQHPVRNEFNPQFNADHQNNTVISAQLPSLSRDSYHRTERVYQSVESSNSPGTEVVRTYTTRNSGDNQHPVRNEFNPQFNADHQNNTVISAQLPLLSGDPRHQSGQVYQSVESSNSPGTKVVRTYTTSNSGANQHPVRNEFNPQFNADHQNNTVISAQLPLLSGDPRHQSGQVYQSVESSNSPGTKVVRTYTTSNSGDNQHPVRNEFNPQFNADQQTNTVISVQYSRR